MSRYIAAIDPDIDKSGLAIYDNERHEWLYVDTIQLEDIPQLLAGRYPREQMTIYVESGWKNDKSNFKRGQKSSVSERIAMNVGMNHASSMLATRILKKNGWTVVEIAPLNKGKGLLKDPRKGWTAYGRAYIEKYSGYTGKRLNSETRDAIFIVMAFRRLKK